MPACSLRSRTGRATARGPKALLDLRCARRPWGVRSGRRNDPSQSNDGMGKIFEVQAGMAMAESNGLPVLSTPKQITSSLRIAATTICLGLRRPAFFRRATSAAIAGLKRIADSAGMLIDDRRVAVPIFEMRGGRSIEEPDRWWLGLRPA